MTFPDFVVIVSMLCSIVSLAAIALASRRSSQRRYEVLAQRLNGDLNALAAMPQDEQQRADLVRWLDEWKRHLLNQPLHVPSQASVAKPTIGAPS